jgi:hypothetical protein
LRVRQSDIRIVKKLKHHRKIEEQKNDFFSSPFEISIVPSQIVFGKYFPKIILFRILFSEIDLNIVLRFILFNHIPVFQILFSKKLTFSENVFLKIQIFWKAEYEITFNHIIVIFFIMFGY